VGAARAVVAACGPGEAVGAARAVVAACGPGEAVGAARAVVAVCGPAGTTAPDDVLAIVPSRLVMPALRMLEPTLGQPSLATASLSPAAFALCATTLRQCLASGGDVDAAMCGRFLRTLAASSALGTPWCAELVVDLFAAAPHWTTRSHALLITDVADAAAAESRVQPRTPTSFRWPLELVSARCSLGRAFLHSASTHECPVSATAVAAIVSSSNSSTPTSVESCGQDGDKSNDMFEPCIEAARMFQSDVDAVVDWLWVALATLPPGAVVAHTARVWTVLSEASSTTTTAAASSAAAAAAGVSSASAAGTSRDPSAPVETQAAIELAVALLEVLSPDASAVAQIAAGNLDDSSLALVAVMADPWALVVVDRADARHDAVLERAVVGVMATLTGFLAHDDMPTSSLFASHRPAATQAGCLLAAVLVTRARVSGGGAAPLGRAMRWAAKVVGGSGTKTRIGDLFMSCPVDSATPLVRAVKRIVEGATEQEDKVKKNHHHLSFRFSVNVT
jgi:hypothetical protein